MTQAPETNGDAGAIVAVPNAEPFSSTAIVPSGDVRTAGFDLNEIKKLATQTKAIGVILPPPDIRAIVDKTASFVAKHGAEFEKRILANEKNNAKFNFLTSTDPYHAYYQMRIKEFGKELGGAAAAGGDAVKDASAAVAEVSKAAPLIIPHALAKLDKPEDEQYTVHVPAGLNLLEMDIIKLVAQFTARNGKSFLTGLASRESTNPLFNFLRENHSLHGFFKGLCDAYSKVLMPEQTNKGIKDKLAKDANDGAATLERCMKRLEWEKVKEREMKDKEDEAERERLAYQSVDWHDFVVVETIEFDEGEDDDLPPPVTLKDVIHMNKAREYGVLEEAEYAAEQGEGEADKQAQRVEMTEEERQLVAQAAAVTIGGVTSAPDQDHEDMAIEDQDHEDMEMGDDDGPAGANAAPPLPDDDDDEPIKVVKDYVRPAARVAMLNGQAYDPTKFAVSPITGELVAIADMAEHMRISLLDPKWKEQKDAMLSKIRENTKAADDEITRNLVGLAKTRPDIFGSTEQEVTAVVSESIREKLTSGVNRPVAWDGVTARGPELANQVANIQQNRAALGTGSAGPAQPARPAIGPSATSQPIPTPLPPIPNPVLSRQAVPAPTPMPPPPPIPNPILSRPPGPPPPIPNSMLPTPPAPPREAPPLAPGDLPESKRQRLDDTFVLQPESEFLQRHSGPSTVRVQCPEVEGNDKLIGQLLEVQVATLSDSVGEFKERLVSVLGIAANKMKISRDVVGFLSDGFSLAHYNVSPHVTLTLGIKDKARGKK